MNATALQHKTLVFDNKPSFEHLAVETRTLALAQHREFERNMSKVPLDCLKHAVELPHNDIFLRQQVAYLITQYFETFKVPLETVMDIIVKANNGILNPSLVSSCHSNHFTFVNLLTLSNETLWRVYCATPLDYRSPSHLKREHKQKRAAPASPNVSVADSAWVCCDQCCKWRRIELNRKLPPTWTCKDHPNNITCLTPEESMEEGEYWNGHTQDENDKNDDKNDDFDDTTTSIPDSSIESELSADTGHILNGMLNDVLHQPTHVCL